MADEEDKCVFVIIFEGGVRKTKFTDFDLPPDMTFEGLLAEVVGENEKLQIDDLASRSISAQIFAKKEMTDSPCDVARMSRKVGPRLTYGL